MRRFTVIHGLHRAILARVPHAHRAEVRALQQAEIEIWCAAMRGGEAESYNAGVKAAQDHEAASQESGFEAGYRQGLDRAIGSIGTPARRVDEDELTVQPS